MARPKPVFVRFTEAEARILREMAFDRLFTLETLPREERGETPKEMAAARRAAEKPLRAILARGETG